MPATVSSRSFGPEPDTSTTAGSGPFAFSGLDNVPAREKPFAGMRTDSSFGRAIVRRRVDTADMSERATSSPWMGMRMRSRRPDSSPQISTSTGGCPGGWNATVVRRASMTRSTVWMRSVVDAPTVAVNDPCAG